MARIPERKFDPARPVFARKYFTANGRKYAPGAPLDWRSASISQRRVMQMFDAGKLKHDDEVTPERIKEEYTPERIDNPLESLDYYTAETDDLDAIDDMKELRAIADSIGAPYKVSKADQRQAIRDHRNKETD
jgi:hypothetical protein